MTIMYHMLIKMKCSCLCSSRILLLIIVSMLFVSCGNKGPLTVPDINNVEINSDQSPRGDTEQ